MADIKVSALPAATTPLNSADVAYVIQAGVSSKTTVADYRTGRAASGANSDITSLSALSTPLSIGQGGTGAASQGAAQTALGLVPGTDVQAYNANLTTWAGKTVPSGTVVGTSDTQTLTAKTLTSPKIGTMIADTGGNELVVLTATASAVNELTLANAATTTNPTITASGGDSNIGVNITAKGTGSLVVGSTTANADSIAILPAAGGGSAFTGTITSADLAAARTWTLPDATGTVALTATTEVPLTFSTGLTRATNTITANLATGVAGGQTATGGTAASEILTLRGTSHATKGKISFDGQGVYDANTIRLGINTNSPSYQLDVNGYMASTGYFLGTDYCILPVAGGMSACSTYWGMELRGNWQGSYANAPANIGANDSVHVVIPGAQATKVVLAVNGAASQSGNLQEWRNSSNTMLSAVDSAGSLLLATAGNGIKIKQGTNATAGRATLVGGTVTVSTTKATTTAEYFLTRRVTGGTVGHLTIGTVTGATSFVITSSSGTDTSDISWMIVEAA